MALMHALKPSKTNKYIHEKLNEMKMKIDFYYPGTFVPLGQIIVTEEMPVWQ